MLYTFSRLFLLFGFVIPTESRPTSEDGDCTSDGFQGFLNKMGKMNGNYDMWCSAIKANNEHNAQNSTFKRGVTSVSDLLEMEYQQHQGYISAQSLDFVEDSDFSSVDESTIPETLDYRESGLVSPVADQGHCRSSWAFAAAGVVESALKKKNGGSLVPLSVQALVDCSRKNAYCNGGNTELALSFVKETGISTAQRTPYLDRVNMCFIYGDDSVVKIQGVKSTIVGDENDLKKALWTIGPIAVAIDANLDSFKNYVSGVYYDEGCRNYRSTHPLLLIGFGTDEQLGDYWLVKNSWGINWGENGYARIARNRDNHCGIASRTSYPEL